MKRCYLVAFLLCVVCLLSFQPISSAAADRYLLVDSSSNQNVYIDTKTIRYTDPNNPKIIEVWELWVYTEEGARKELENRAKNGLPTAGFENLQKKMVRLIVSSDGKYLLKVVSFYAKDGSQLLSVDIDMNEWHDIPPGTIVEAVKDSAFSYMKKTKK